MPSISITLQGESVSDIHNQMTAFLAGSGLKPATDSAFERQNPQLKPTVVNHAPQVSKSVDPVEPLLAASKVNAEKPTRTITEIAAASEPKKRHRRTKAEIEAERAQQAEGVTTAAGKLEPEPVFETRTEAPAAATAAPTTTPIPTNNKEAVHQALQQVNVSVGLLKAREILTSFSAQRISDLKEDQFKPFIDKCNEALMMG